MLLSTLNNRRFSPLLASQFLSALNESFMRLVFLFFVTYQMSMQSPMIIITSVVLYALVYCATSVYAGQFADKYAKSTLIRWIRLLEVGLMVLALFSLSINSLFLFVMIIASMGFVGAMMRVLNYSILPTLVPTNQLNAGNTWLKMATVLSYVFAVLLLVSILKFNAKYEMILLLGIVLSFVGYLISLKIPATPAAEADLKIISQPLQVFGSVATSLKNKFDSWSYLTGIAWFWLLGTVVFTFSAEYGKEILNARWSVVMFLTSVFAIGYGLGSLFYARVSRKNNMGAYTSFVTFLITVFLFDLVMASDNLLKETVSNLSISKFLTTDFEYWRILTDIFVLGGLAAFYIIAFYTLLQMKTNTQSIGRVFAFSNMVNALGVTIGFLFVLAIKLMLFNILTVLLIFSILNIFIAIYMTRLLPIDSRRRMFKRVFSFLYGAKIVGLENLEKAGKRALIMTNHSSYMDVLLISTFIDRKIVFAINDKLMEKPFVKFMTNLVDVRPLDPLSPFAVKDMVEELRKDQLCMIFTEGFISDGNTRMKIYEGPAMMAVKGEAPIVPIRIDGARFTFFSRVLKTKADFRWFPKITLTVLPPVDFKYPDDMPTRECREKSSSKLYDIHSNMNFDSYEKDLTIFEALARAMRMTGKFKPILEDTTRQPLKYFSVFMRAFILGKLIHRAIPDEKYVGLMLPTSNACLLSFLGLHAFAKIPAMINFSSGPKQVIATCKTIDLKTVITAKKVVQLGKLDALVEEIEAAGVRILYLEDLKPTLKTTDKVFGIKGALNPLKVYRKTTEQSIESRDPAVILFTSGSEGMPKAVFLTHKNILSNCYQVPSRLDVLPNDVMMNCLPMFHSFGLGAGTILPLLLGVKTVLYPTPLHYRIIPEICASTRATLLLGTDTFLAGYAKCANPYDFNSLRLVAAGAEKVKDETRKVWSEKFGIRILEGYGATECSPFISVNTFLHSRKGSVGRVLPGIETKLKPVEGIKDGAELWLKGPNIMMGYMRFEKPLELDPPKDGWYDTGDIVDIDEEGYIFIKGRCKRFAKIGGEMVSLTSVENVIDKKWPGFVSGAVNIPDARKGEKIVLITTCKDITKEGMIEAFKSAGVTELGLPSKVIVTDEPPLLGSGKFNYVAAKELAIKEDA